VSSHAFTKKSDYINSLEFKVKKIDFKLLQVITPSLEETSKVVFFLEDLNLILQALKTTIPVKINNTWERFFLG
jgi:hypothetical protein